MKARTEGEVAAKPLGDSSPFSPSARISFRGITGHVRLLICFRHLVYHFFAYLPHKATFVPTVEVVKEQQFLIFLPYSAGYVVIHNVGYEILRQTFRINDSSAVFFEIFHNIPYGFAKTCSFTSLKSDLPNLSLKYVF